MIYQPKGVCSKAIDVEVEEGIIKSVQFTGGCNGNTQGISKLVVGMKAEEAISRLRGIKCGFKNTSCPDQLACALQEILDH
ncbi:MAG: TIGR03905 family TSCPD domain-containing protein [Lachnospiraceae bacterium]|nr:TIGR03905 family TSCPD domain-containing protein [Lachnospiraceae bacterium]